MKTVDEFTMKTVDEFYGLNFHLLRHHIIRQAEKETVNPMLSCLKT